MGISEGGEGGSVVDCSVGTIVWVRRRNGSWWPGRILGPEELSASHLMSPRSGTPVKLLGREDASVPCTFTDCLCVCGNFTSGHNHLLCATYLKCMMCQHNCDWYNLEKSKRVKAFRCGEFDACIERAEASQGIPIKKREKYARREDAILHALELEKQQLETKHQKFGTISNGTSQRNSDVHRRELHSFSSDIYMRDDEPRAHGKYANNKSHMFSRKAVLSGEEDNKGNYVHKGKTSKRSGWEDYNSESLPRMRGLQDFGLRIAPLKKKVSQSVTWEVPRIPLDIHVDALSDMGHVMGDAGHPGGSKNSLAIKRKRSLGGNGEDSLVKKRDRRRPLVQVLQSSAKLPVSDSFQSEYDSGGISMQGERDNMGIVCRAKRSRCVYLPADSNDSLDGNGYPSEEMPGTAAQLGSGSYLDYPGLLAEEYSSSGLAEETESDSSETDYLEPDLEEDGNLTDTTQALVPVSKDFDPLEVQVSENFSRDLNNDEVPLLGYMPPLHLQDQMMDTSADAGVSKWHMKGKRNVRNIAKRPVDLMDGKISSTAEKYNGPIRGISYESMGSSFKMRGTISSGQRAAGQGFYHYKESSSHFATDGLNTIEDLGHSPLMGYGNRRYPLPLQGAKDCGRSHSSFHDSDNDSRLLSPRSWGADGPSSHMPRRVYWEESDECFDPDYADHLGDEMESMLVDVDIQVQKRSYQGEHVPWVSLSSKWNGGKPILGHPVQIEILGDGSTAHLVSKYETGLEESSIPPAFRRTAKRSVMHRIPRSNPVASAFEEDADPLDSDQEMKPPHKKAYTGYFNHQAKSAKKSSSHTRQPTMPGKFQKKLKASISSQKTRTLSSLATEHRFGRDGGSVKLSRRKNDILDGLIKPEGGIPLVTCVPVKVVFSRILEAVGRPSSVSAHRRLASPAVRGLS